MNSATDVWPEGLGSSSGELGHNIMDHHLGVGASGRVEGYEDKYYFGRRANGIYIPRYQNFAGDKRDYLRGFGYQGGASRSGWGRDVAELSIGGEFKDALTEPGSWSMGMGGFGEILPDHSNKVTLDKNVKDKWGLNVLSFDAELKENEFNQVWDAPNVYVTDGAFMTSAACVNPSLTYMAFTARAVDHAVTELKKQNL